jgi:hypothetical protein
VVTLTNSGSIDILTIPVDATFSVSFSGVSGTVEFKGNIVSEYAVPEPSTLALLIASAVSLPAIAWRRRTHATKGKIPNGRAGSLLPRRGT